MSIYRDLLGDDPRTTFLLAVVGKKREDLAGFVSADLQGQAVLVTTASGTKSFRIPNRWQHEVANMDDILTDGMSYELEQHIAKVLGHE